MSMSNRFWGQGVALRNVSSKCWPQGAALMNVSGIWTLIHAFHQIQAFSTSQLAKAIVCDDREADKDVLAN